MARRTKVYLQMNWRGGINTAIEPGILPDTDLAIADNIIMSTIGSRKKREGLVHFDSDIPTPDFRSSSGTTRTLKWTTNSLQVATPNDDKLVNGEKITVTTTATSGNETSYPATAVAIASLTNIAEVTDVQCVADSSGSLNNTFFNLYSAEDATRYYVWFNVNAAGTDPAVTGATGVEVALATNDGANTVASAVQTAVDALGDFGASVTTDTVTVTNAASGITTDASNGTATPGFTITVTTQGGHTITYTATGSLSESETASSTITIAKASKVVNMLDYWRLDSSTVKQQVLLAATDQFKLFSYDSDGARTEVSGSGGPSGTVTQVRSIVMNDKAIFTFDALADKPVKYDPDASSSYAALGGTPPDFSIMGKHLSRLWTNDKANPDRVHYSSTGNPEEWNGDGDSGAIDIGVDDGDSIGITGIFVYKGILFVAKRDSLFRILGNTPETFKVEDVSKGIGIESQSSIVAVDQDDVVFTSRRGFHSVAATSNFGDVESSFISSKIQPTFDAFQSGRLKFIQGAYVPRLNSLAFSVSENSASQNALYFYNVIFREWYRWPGISCESITTRRNSDQVELMIGNATGRIIRTQRGTFTDYTATPITYRIKTGTIYPGGNAQTWKGFKRLTLFYKPKAETTFTATVKIDNQASQSMVFQGTAGSALLGVDFVLGVSVLAASDVFAPFSKDITGHGRGMTLEVVQSGTESQVEIYGYSIEFEEEDIVPEVIST